MYIDKASKWQIIVVNVGTLFWLILAVLSSGLVGTRSSGSSTLASIFFLLLAVAFFFYALNGSVHKVIFDPQLSDLRIKRLFRKTITISRQDCIKVTKTSGATSLPKLIFMNGNRKDSVVMYTTDFEVTKAWTEYTQRWLSDLRTKRVVGDDEEEARILASSSEEDYERRYGIKP